MNQDQHVDDKAGICAVELARELRRQAAIRDAEILARSESDPDLDAFVKFAVGIRLDID